MVKDLGQVDVKRGIFQGDSLSPVVCFEYGTFVFDI